VIAAGLSRRYAKALFELAVENQSEEKVSQELQSLSEALTGSPLGLVLNNPAYDLLKRKNILDQVTRTSQLSHLTTRFLFLLLERRRLESFSAIVNQYKKLLNESKRRIEARVIASTPLDDVALAKVSAQLAQLSGKEVLLQSETDPSLIGGLIIELEGRTYDGSVRSYLEALKDRIESGN
jgi:F-type H+-transporting ATPase subunit delta